MSLQYEGSITSGNEAAFDAQDELIKRTNFLVEHLGKTGLRGYALEISDNLGSLLAAIMAQKAVEQQRRLGHEMYFHGILTRPDQFSNPEDLQLALEVIHPDKLHQIDIKPSLKAYNKAFKKSEGYVIGQLDNRLSALTSYTIASEHRLAVIDSRVDDSNLTSLFSNDTIQPLNGLTLLQQEAMLRFSGAPYVLVYKDEFESPATASRAA